jgi:hypothetical protein
LAPFVAGVIFVNSARGTLRALLWALLASSAAILLFLSATGFTTQRYEVDFMPPLVLAAVTGAAVRIGTLKGALRTAIQSAFVLAIGLSVVANMALGIAGPYGEMLKQRPGEYVRIARCFSPVRKLRPLLNPAVNVAFAAEFPSRPGAFREPLLAMGRQAHWSVLYVEQSAASMRLVSQSDNSTVASTTNLPRHADIGVTYDGRSGILAARVNGREALVHKIGVLVTAPVEVTPGENRIEPNIAAPRFTGRIGNIVKTVRER